MVFLACALHHAPEVWRNETAIREYMALRAHKEAHIATVISMVQAQDHFIQEHLNGNLLKADARPAPTNAEAYFGEEEEATDSLVFAGEQIRLEDNINKRVD